MGVQTCGCLVPRLELLKIFVQFLEFGNAHNAAVGMRHLPFDTKKIHKFTYAFLFVRRRDLYVIAQNQVCMPYNGDKGMLTE